MKYSILKKTAVVLLSLIALSGTGAGVASASSMTGNTGTYPLYMPSARHHKTHRRRVVKRMERIAKSKLGDSYEWGGNGPDRFDCSGFTKYIYHHGAHKSIPRLAGDQFTAGRAETEHQAKPGDLVFFGSSQHNISHVGMYLGHDKMIDAQLRGVVIEHVHAPWWHEVGFARLNK